ncbi:hypothetical protein HAY27_004678, partial [Salmonella enterica]|nr:hypothetical protein [Salmonella enterica]
GGFTEGGHTDNSAVQADVFEHWLATCRARGTSVVAISHDAAFTRRHFSRVVRLHNSTSIG